MIEVGRRLELVVEIVLDSDVGLHGVCMSGCLRLYVDAFRAGDLGAARGLLTWKNAVVPVTVAWSLGTATVYMTQYGLDGLGELQWMQYPCCWSDKLLSRSDVASENMRLPKLVFIREAEPLLTPGRK